MSSSVKPSVEITSMSITFSSSKYVSMVSFISGLVAVIPAKNPTPSNTIATIDRNRLNVFFICLTLSFKSDFSIIYISFRKVVIVF